MLTQYPERERLAADVLAALGEFPSLLPRTDVYSTSARRGADTAYDDGRSLLLLLLDGTLPVPFEGTLYHSPVHVWIPRAYPREPPIVLVAPTPDMMVRRSAHVEPSGRVWAAYIRAWERKFEVRLALSR